MPSDVVLAGENRGGLSVHCVESVRRFGVDAFVTDRFGGMSVGPYESLNLGTHVGDDADAVSQNRRRVTEAIGVPLDRLVSVRQVHGIDVLDARSVTAASEADAIVSDETDVALAVLVADCVPLLLVDALSPRFALVHAGWRGLARGVLARTLEHFADARSVHAFIGPSISLEGYQVGPEVAANFAYLPAALVADGGDRSRLDLRHVATTQLIEAGVEDKHVSRSLEVTDGGEVFFSDRAHRPCGRFALVAKRAP
jgi:YfiH family protein